MRSAKGAAVFEAALALLTSVISGNSLEERGFGITNPA
jgi:hypothetical protein